MAIESEVSDTIKQKAVTTKKYRFMDAGLYVKYKYHIAVWSKTMPPSVAVTGITVFTRSFDVSVFPTSWDKKYATAPIKPISRAPRTDTSVEPLGDSI